MIPLVLGGPIAPQTKTYDWTRALGLYHQCDIRCLQAEWVLVCR